MKYELAATMVEATVDDDEGLSSVFFRAGPRDDRMVSIARYAADAEDDGRCELGIGNQLLQAKLVPASVVVGPGRLGLTVPDSAVDAMVGFREVSVTWDPSAVNAAELEAGLADVLRGYSPRP